MITILIANHNYGQYLEDCLRSAKNQSMPCRVCFVDDGSTDNSVEVAKSILDENDIIIERKESGGPSAARNDGIKRTIHDTEFYIILDSDDIMMENKVEKFYKQFLLNKNQIGVIYADYYLFDETSIKMEFKEPYSINRLLQECIVHSGAGISSLALQAVQKTNGQYFNEEMRTAEDYELWVRIAKKFMIIHIPEILTSVRVHPKNSTQSVDRKVWEDNWKRVRDAINGE